ncbi:hypothetical protein [Actinoplanes sp. NPDC051411]|uniref:hypothetical protein n=1 Tax=Actinoplanes sp. NPDC051411 TaxID=3155522 RepID=UPI00343A4B19
MCSGQKQTFSLVSYTTSSAGFAYPQFIYDSDQATVDPAHPTVHLAVTVPACYFQVDLIFGSSLFNEVVNADSNYANLKLGAPYGTGSRSDGPYGGDADGRTPCLPKPLVTYENACDGTFTATLANEPAANIDAVFIVAGQRVHVKPGRTAGARRRTGSLSIRDNTFTTHIASWEKPASCSSGSPSVTSKPAGPTPPPSSGVGSGPTTPPTFTDSIAPLDPTDDGGIPVNPGAPTSAAAAPVSDSGSSSALIIALGVVLMLAGLVILVRVLKTFRRP